MSDEVIRPYQRAQLFSGGGSRFGYYLGSYAALVAHDLTPDLIIGTCGGSLSALLVQLAAEPKDLQALAYSPELYQVIKAIRHVSPDEANKRLKLRYLTQAIKRWRSSRQKGYAQHRESYQQLLDELQQLAMFRVDNEPYWLDELLTLLPHNAQDNAKDNVQNRMKTPTPDIAIIGSRLLQASDSQITASQPPQLQELLFAPKGLPLAANDISLSLSLDRLISPAHAFANGRIQPTVKVVTHWDTATAVRASMADMYYLPPIHDSDLGWCLGGVINLTPIELACQLATSVFAETKAGYDAWLAAPAIQRVFGFDPNQRLDQVHRYVPPKYNHKHNDDDHNSNDQQNSQLHWLPLADNGQHLSGSVQKRFSLKQMTVELIHSDYDGFVQQMQAQWHYGYQRTSHYIQQQGF